MRRRGRAVLLLIAAALLMAFSISEQSTGSIATLGTVWKGQGGVLSAGPGYPDAGAEAVFQRQLQYDSITTIAGVFGRIEFTSRPLTVRAGLDAAEIERLHRATAPQIKREVRQKLGREPTEAELATILSGGTMTAQRGVWALEGWRFLRVGALVLAAAGLVVLATSERALRGFARAANRGGCGECGYGGAGGTTVCQECGATRV